jgi:hypothetical protein
MLDIFIGYDPRDDKAFRVCEASLKRHAGGEIRVWPIKEWEVRRLGYGRAYRVEKNGQMIDALDGKPFSTQFSFTRFLVPALADYKDALCVYMDADMLVRADIFELIALARENPDKAVYCVPHEHRPRETTKMDGVVQTHIHRKNWSSLVIWNPSRNRFLTPERVSELPGSYLHAFSWLADDEIGSLPEQWNWLEGWSPERLEPKIVHFTRGTPDMTGHETAAYAAEWIAEWKKTSPSGSEFERSPWSRRATLAPSESERQWNPVLGRKSNPWDG